MPWFQRRRAVAEQEQRRLWRLARMKTDMRQITSQMNELEAVDSFNAIEKHINEEVKVCLLYLLTLNFMFMLLLCKILLFRFECYILFGNSHVNNIIFLFCTCMPERCKDRFYLVSYVLLCIL